MCLAVPAKVISIDREKVLAVTERNGINRAVSLMLLPDAEVGDFVLVHAGFAIEKVADTDAAETDALLREMNGGDREFWLHEESRA